MSGRPSVLLVNPMDKVRPEVVKLTSSSVTDHVNIRVLLPEKCRGRVSRNKDVMYYFYDARFVPNIRYTLPTPSFVQTLHAQCEVVDIVHTLGYVYLPSLVTTAVAAPRDTSTVITVDAFPGESWSYGNRVVDAVAKVYTHLFAEPMFGVADAVVGLGEYNRDDFKTFVDDSSKISIIPNGVDTERYSPTNTTATAHETDGSSGLPPAKCTTDQIDLLYIGRLDTVKGLPYLLDAMATLRMDTKQFTLTIVGEGSRRDHLEDRCRELGIADIVTFEGWQTDTVSYYRTHDIFVLPSISEGLPTVLTEAQSCGIPVVSTDVGGAREQIQDGIVVPTEDADALAEAVSTLAEQNLFLCGRNARSHIVENYSLSAMSNSYIKLYTQLAG